MAALAAGAQVEPGSVLLINVLDDLANTTPRCSALAVGEAHTRDGSYLMGRNLDYSVVRRHSGAPARFYFSWTRRRVRPWRPWPGRGTWGCAPASNKAGVALAQLSAPSRDRSLRGMPAALRFRLALEQGASAEAAADQVLRLPGTIGNNLLLCDPQEALVLELSARRGVRRRPRQGLITASNHYQSPAMQDLKGRFPPRTPYSPLPAYYFTEAYSRARDRRLQELAAGRRLAPSDLQKILADEAVANAGTVMCVVFAPGKHTIWVAPGGKAPGEPRAFHCQDLVVIARTPSFYPTSPGSGGHVPSFPHALLVN